MLYNAYCQYILYTAYLDDIDYDVNGCEESIPGKLRGLSPWQLALQSVERNVDPFVLGESKSLCPHCLAQIHNVAYRIQHPKVV